MSRKVPQYDDYRVAVQQIILSSSDSDYLDQLIPALKDATNSNRTPGLMQSLSQYANEREADIERIGLTKHDEFLQSVNQLQKVREGTVALTSEILQLNQSIQASTEKLAAQKEALVDTKAIRQNIAEAAEALKESLKILHAVNQAHDLIKKKKYYAALKALDDLQNEHLIPTIQNKYATQHRLADIIQKSIPSSQKAISEAVMSDLNTWLYRIRETSQFLGEVAFYHTELRRTRQKERMESDEYLRNFKLNSAIELVFDESEEFDVLDNEELQVDFTPLFECLHIHEALGQSDKFRSDYAATRRKQKELLLPTAISLVDDDENSLSSLLEGIAGFAIIEKATMRRAHNLRSPVDVDELWDSMCQTAISLITKALDTIDNAEVLLKIKGVIALFIQTMDGWGYSVTTLDNFLLTLFDKYAELLKKRFSEDFQEIVSTDDYMPMPISNLEEYDKVINVSWFTPDKPREELTFPCVLPFSQMYPLCCIDIRNFLNQFYFFSDDHFQHPNVIDETLKKSLDQLLSEKVCSSLVERLSSQYLGQIVQILINLEHFETACRELEQLLIAARSSSSAGGPIVLDATEDFRSNKKTAEKRIFELVNSKIDDLVETAEYDWMAPTLETEPSNYMQTLTRYLSNIMNSTLLGLPREIKELIYFDALSHAANMILALPLSPEVKKINPNGVAALAKDVTYLSDFVDTLENAPILKENLDELQQTVLLMQTENPDDFYDISIRNKKFGRVDAMNGPKILEKITHSVMQSPSRTDRLGNFSSRFGMR
ncbi:exocyst complex subunit Sec15-like protein [Mollisia scopiformis]|uniref:Exocyst complex component SEC15 n=1 Tax=Mollisia scopiformis TaxID=149040 RepID=A0A194XI35_MOLSC|nr:exocyst complex subunit Sec15-like protein [Mollisia scopiformis]KUJ19789.1 exocyst complex subunit Sec15-like protein [Mollisia scopiformis]